MGLFAFICVFKVNVYYHRNSVAAVEEELGHKMLDIKAVKKLLEQRKVNQNINNPMNRTGKRKANSRMESFDGITLTLSMNQTLA